VAGFIGSPAMNFFSSLLVREGDKLIVDGGSFKVEVPADRVSTYAPEIGKPVIFGIRPEDIHNPDFAPPGITAQTVPAVVDVTELMGNEIFVYLKSGEHSFVARVDPRSRYKIGDEVPVVFNMDNMHIFDKETELAVR
jgi:multiple sugar transport system ATP-binding protein